MRVGIIAIGNSKGIRLSKSLLERYGLSEQVELVLEEERIILRPVKAPRQGWDRAFKRMASNRDDALLIPDMFRDEEPDA